MSNDMFASNHPDVIAVKEAYAQIELGVRRMERTPEVEE
jgi:hypothetical protein